MKSRDLVARWERDTRYYIVHVHRDLWGALTVTRAWGGRGTAQGQVRHCVCDTRSSAAQLLLRVRRERHAHGYRRRFRSGLLNSHPISFGHVSATTVNDSGPSSG